MLLLLFSWLLFLLALYWREQASSVSGEAKEGRGIGEAIGLVGLVFRGGRWRRNVFGQVSLLTNSWKRLECIYVKYKIIFAASEWAGSPQ